MIRRLQVVCAAIAVVCLAGFWELAEDFAYSPAVAYFDSVVSAAIQSLRAPWLTGLMWGFTIAGGRLGVVLGTIALVALAYRRHRDAALFAVIAVAGGGLLTAVTKDYFGRVRPPVDNALIKLPESFSFPSGHTMGSLCLAWAMGYLVYESGLTGWRRFAAYAVIAIYPIAVGVSRVYLGVHWPSDVLASWLLAAAWLAIATAGFETWRRRTGGLSKADAPS